VRELIRVKSSGFEACTSVFKLLGCVPDVGGGPCSCELPHVVYTFVGHVRCIRVLDTCTDVKYSTRVVM